MKEGKESGLIFSGTEPGESGRYVQVTNCTKEPIQACIKTIEFMITGLSMFLGATQSHLSPSW